MTRIKYSVVMANRYQIQQLLEQLHIFVRDIDSGEDRNVNIKDNLDSLHAHF